MTRVERTPRLRSLFVEPALSDPAHRPHEDTSETTRIDCGLDGNGERARRIEGSSEGGPRRVDAHLFPGIARGTDPVVAALQGGTDGKGLIARDPRDVRRWRRAARIRVAVRP